MGGSGAINYKKKPTTQLSVATAAEVLTGTNNTKAVSPLAYQDAWGQKNKYAVIIAMKTQSGN